MVKILRLSLIALFLSTAFPAEAQILKRLRKAVDDVIVTPNERRATCTFATLTNADGVLFSDDFESGSFRDMWAPRPSEEVGVVEVIDRMQDARNLPYEGDFALAIGREGDTRFTGTFNESAISSADLCLDLSGQVDASLHFYIRDQIDENTASDAILLSDDGGETFHPALRLQPSSWGDQIYGMVTVDLSAAADQLGLSLSEQFVIRFQQGGVADFIDARSRPQHMDGFFIDNVVVMGSPIYARAPFRDGFESGTLGPAWRVADPFRKGETAPELQSQWGFVKPVQRLPDVPPVPRTGNYSLAMGRPAGSDARHTPSLVTAADLHLDLAGKEEATLRFFLRHELDEASEFDGIFLSSDGGKNFTRALSFELSRKEYSTYKENVLDLTEMVKQTDLTFSDQFIVRIQQMGAADFAGTMFNSRDGFLIDDLVVDAPLSPKEEAVARLEVALRDWRQQGRYEKTEDYEARLRDGEAAAKDSLSQLVLAEIVQSRIDLSAVRTMYDPDTEIFTLTVDHLKPFTLAVPIAEAEAFDKNLQILEYHNPVYAFGSGDTLELVSAEVVNPANGKTYALSRQE
jgi:hypothetical protein